ncbi:MAG TPA: hypothetical protein VGB92_23515 [Longimicrobium sp.]|jgi:hypothetical protein
MKPVFLAALLLTLLAPAGVVAQPGPEQRIEAARRRAAELQIPVALLDSKVVEGRAKGIPEVRIAGAVEHRLELLARARQAMGARGVAPTDLSMGADALEAGVTPEVLNTLSAQAPAPQRAMAIAVLSQLVRAGEASERALARVRAAMSRGPDALRELPGEAASARSGQQEPTPGRAPNANPGERGKRGDAGPPASVPAPGEGRGRGRGRENTRN